MVQAFRGNVANWNVARVITMAQMFAGTGQFNGDVSKWNVASVSTMVSM
jgi:surface protein